MTLSAPSDVLESCIVWSVPFDSTICTSTRMVFSSTWKASSRMKCHPPDLVKQHLDLSRLLDMQPWVIRVDHELVVWWMNNWLLMYGEWTMYGDHEHCLVDQHADVWCPLVLTFDVRWINYVWWIMVEYMFSFWYWLLMDNGCVYICLAFVTDFWWMMTVIIFIICF
jgi:hypothetical protein